MNIQEGNCKLLQLASLLESRATLSTRVPLVKYDQSRFYHTCGSPACALGLWAFMNPETWDIIKLENGYIGPVKKGMSLTNQNIIESPMKEFAISHHEYRELFSGFGCNWASNEIAAASYIRKFVERRTNTVPVKQEHEKIEV